jgi:2'-5' RNA ligase
VTFGPTPYNPRLVWVEGSSTPALSRIKEELEFVLRKEGDLRPFKPHLTLARFDPDRFDRFPIKKLRWPIDWVQKAGSLVLMESSMQRHGAEYKVLAEVKL